MTTGSLRQRIQILEDIEVTRKLKASDCAGCDDHHHVFNPVFES